MLTTTLDTLGSVKASILRRVTTTTFSHRGLLIRSCTIRPPTFPVAPKTMAEYSAFASVVTSHPAEPQCIDIDHWVSLPMIVPRGHVVGMGIVRLAHVPTCLRQLAVRSELSEIPLPRLGRFPSSDGMSMAPGFRRAL